MKIAISGYGRMGHQIKDIALQQGISVNAIIDPYSSDSEIPSFKTIEEADLSGVDVVIDFTIPDTVFKNVEALVEKKVNIVLGTTGWYDQMDKMKNIIGDKVGLLWSGNFSVGVNIFYRIVRQSAKLFSKFEQYDPIALELHHKMKKDSPSGTALMITDEIQKSYNNKDKVVTERLDRQISDNEIHLASARGGYIPGTHMVYFDSPQDTIELKHTARTREGFAVGAVEAAKWIKGKKGIFHIDRMFDELL